MHENVSGLRSRSPELKYYHGMMKICFLSQVKVTRTLNLPWYDENLFPVLGQGHHLNITMV